MGTESRTHSTRKGEINVNRSADYEVKMSMVSQLRDYWMENRARCLRTFWVTIGLVALIAFIYVLHLDVARG
jgi:hypothetical protein